MADARTPEHLRNVIVGGGIGGLAAALALSSAGLPVTLLERVTRPADVGAGIALHPNGLAVLYGLGLREPLRRTAFATREGTLGVGGRRYTLGVPDYGDGLDHALALPRARLYQVLHEALAARGADLRFGHEVLGAAPDGRVEVRAPDGGVYEIDADVVVGADGVGSAVRGGAEFGVRRTATPGIAVRALLPGDPFGGRELELWTEDGIAVAAPMGDGTSYLALSASRGPMRRAMTEGDLATLRRLAARALPGADVLAAVRGFGELLVNPIVTVTCERWQNGRLALLGDAAHAMSPHLGQGANSALLDAYVLAEELAREQARPAAIARYASRRRPSVTRVQRMSHAYMFAAERPTMPVVRQARNGLMAAVLPLAGRRSPLGLILQGDPARTYAAVRRLVPSAPR